METRTYDLIFICRPGMPEEEIDKLVGVVEHAAAERGGKIEKVEKWGTRKLAYRIARHREGYYVYAVLRGTQGEMVKEVERRLKVSDPVIKYMTVRTDLEQKRLQKLSQKRERRAARRPRRAPAPHSGEAAATTAAN